MGENRTLLHVNTRGADQPVHLHIPWVKVFRINYEFRILRLTFHKASLISFQVI